MVSKNSVLTASSSLLLLCFSCGKVAQESSKKSGIILENMDKSVNPGDNFEAYVSGTWLKNHEIPSDKSSYGVSEKLEDQAQEDVKAIIESASKGNFETDTDEQKIGDFYQAYLDIKTRNQKGISPLKPEFKTIDAIANYDDLAAYFGVCIAKGLQSPMGIFVSEDFKDPTKYMLVTWQSGLGLPEAEYYLKQDAKSKDIRLKYIDHITKMLILGGEQDAINKAKTILDLETLIASKHMKKEDTRNTVALYNKYLVSDLKKLTPDFNWNKMLLSAGVTNQKEIVISQVEYTKALNEIIKNTSIENWKTYLKWGALHNYAGILDEKIDQENFAFYGKIITGTQQQQPLWRRGVSRVNENLGEIVGKVYVKKHFTPEAKAKMTVLVKNLLKAYGESIKSLDWMTAPTKKEALAKLDKFMLKIGYPDKWRDYSKLHVTKGDLFGNMQKATAFEYQRNIAKLGKPVDRTEWGMTPQTVNAYYNPTLNEIVFPAAILQPPFFDLNADDAINYGSIGAVIGHEIGHGFDDQGCMFDGNGVMRNWWTPTDFKQFQEKTAVLVSQFNQYKPFKDLSINGSFTLGENIGDLGGLSIAVKGYQMSLQGKPAKDMDGFSGEQRVFIGYAQSWLTKQREEALRSQVANDPHAPAKYRVNGIVRNIPEFYTAFKIKPSDSLYLAPKDRVKIW